MQAKSILFSAIRSAIAEPNPQPRGPSTFVSDLERYGTAVRHVTSSCLGYVQYDHVPYLDFVDKQISELHQ